MGYFIHPEPVEAAQRERMYQEIKNRMMIDMRTHMTELKRFLHSVVCAEESLMFDYSPGATTAKGHLRIAKLAIQEAMKVDKVDE